MLFERYGLTSVARLQPYRTLRPLLSTLPCIYRQYATGHSEPKDVAILGGGITGLASAYYLAQASPSTTISIYEAGPRIGGWLSSKSVEVDDGTVLFEAGPRTLRPHGNGVLAARLIHELDLFDETIFTYNSSPAAINRFIYYPDHLVRVPMPQLGLVNLFRTLLTEPAFEQLLWRMPLEGTRSPRKSNLDDESIGDFFSRRLGNKAVDRVFSAIIHGIYAGDVWQLSAKSLFPTQWRDELEHGSISEGVLKSMFEGPELNDREASFLRAMKSLPPLPSEVESRFKRANVFTFREGLSQLVKKLIDNLRARQNVKFFTDTSAQGINVQADGKLSVSLRGLSSSAAKAAEYQPTESTHTHVISCLSPAHLSKVVAKPSLASHLGKIPAVTVMTVSLYYRTANLHPPGFGYLIPLATPLDQNPERALGVVFDTSYSPGPDSEGIEGPVQDTVQNRGTKMTVMLGGHYWNDWPAYPTKEEGLQMAQSLLERHLGISEKPAAHLVSLQHDCIPQYTVGHERRLRGAHESLTQTFNGKLRVAGNWTRGVGVNDCLRSAWDVVKDLDNEGKTGLEAAVEDKKWVRLKVKKT